MSAKLKKKAFAGYAATAVAALLIIGVTVTAVMIRAKHKEVEIIPASDKEVENSKNDRTKTGDNKTTFASQTKATTAPSVSTSASVSYPVDINKADAALLCTIDGVGSVTAQHILDYKAKVGVIHSMDELLNIDGIGTKTLEKLKKYLFVSDKDKAVTANATITSKAKTIQSSLTTATTKPKTSKTTVKRTYSQVNINTATAQQIAQALLISVERAQKVVDMRIKISGYTTKLEILLSEAISEEEYLKLEKYILV